MVEKLFGAALRDRAVALDVVPKLAAGGILNDHVHVGTSINRLVHAKKFTTIGGSVQVARVQLNDVGVANILEHVDFAANALHVLNVLQRRKSINESKIGG